MCRNIKPTFLIQKQKVSLFTDGNIWKAQVPEGLEK